MYHYTSQHGILGIVENSSVWATNTLFLNDSSEFSHALSFANKVAGSIFMEDDYLSAFGWALQDGIHRINGGDIYVSSFSEKPDLLSQWRGYCPGDSGYCLGFDKDAIEKYCTENQLRFEKCIYMHEEQVDKIKSLVNECFLMFPQPQISREEYDSYTPEAQASFELNYHKSTSEGSDKEKAENAIKWFCNEVAQLAPLFKNEAFHEEAEWRVIMKSPPEPIKFRAGKSHLIPYVELQFLEFAENYALQKVIIGPGPNQQRNKESVNFFFEAQNLNDIEIKKSRIPYNNW